MASLWCLYCELWTNFTPWPSVAIVNFEHVIAGWNVSYDPAYIAIFLKSWWCDCVFNKKDNVFFRLFSHFANRFCSEILLHGNVFTLQHAECFGINCPYGIGTMKINVTLNTVKTTLDETHLVVRGLVHWEVSAKCVNEQSSFECPSYYLQVQQICSAVMSKPESILIRQEQKGLSLVKAPLSV